MHMPHAHATCTCNTATGTGMALSLTLIACVLLHPRDAAASHNVRRARKMSQHFSRRPMRSLRASSCSGPACFSTMPSTGTAATACTSERPTKESCAHDPMLGLRWTVDGLRVERKGYPVPVAVRTQL